jgi:hypothetical protein
MCIYCGTNKYRKIYEHHHGPIPKDDQGRSFHIHHIDGDHNNNDPTNLKAVSVQEHYDIHYSQQDWLACWKLGQTLRLTSRRGKPGAFRPWMDSGDKPNYFGKTHMIQLHFPSQSHKYICHLTSGLGQEVPSTPVESDQTCGVGSCARTHIKPQKWGTR